MSNLTKYVFGYMTWHQYMTRLRNTVAAGAIYQAGATESAGARVQGEIRALSDQVQKSAEAIELGLSFISEQLEYQTGLLEGISESLEDIRYTLKSPQGTKAAEQFRLGEERLKRGLLKEALQSFHKAEAIDEVNVALQLHIGQLYLYGVDEEESLIDLQLAMKHLSKALRYDRRQSAEVSYHASVLYFILASEDRLTAGMEEPAKLRKAAELCTDALRTSPHKTEYRYFLAKIYAADPETDQLARAQLRELFTVAPYYSKFASEDPQFEIMSEAIPSLLSEAGESGMHRAAGLAMQELAKASGEAEKCEYIFLAGYRLKTLRTAREELEAGFRKGDVYLPKFIVSALYLSLAFYELITSCLSCLPFREKLYMGHLDRLMPRGTITDLPGGGESQAGTKKRPFWQLLSKSEERVRPNPRNRAQGMVSRESNASTSPREHPSFSVEINGLRAGEISLIQEEDKDFSLNKWSPQTESDDHDVQYLENSLRNSWEAYRLHLKGWLSLWSTHFSLSDLSQADKQIKKRLWERYAPEERCPIEDSRERVLSEELVANVADFVDQSNVAVRAGTIESNKANFSAAFGFRPIYYRLAWSIRDLCQEELQDVFFGTFGIPHNVLSYVNGTSIRGCIQYRLRAE